MIPSAPRPLSGGMISRTTFSSMIVSTATQSRLAGWETVGLRSAGSAFEEVAEPRFGQVHFQAHFFPRSVRALQEQWQAAACSPRTSRRKLTA